MADLAMESFLHLDKTNFSEKLGWVEEDNNPGRNRSIVE